jgi:hypothetical protein
MNLKRLHFIVQFCFCNTSLNDLKVHYASEINKLEYIRKQFQVIGQRNLSETCILKKAKNQNKNREKNESISGA